MKDLEQLAIERQHFYFGRRYVGASLAKLNFYPWVSETIHNWTNNPKNMLIFLGQPGIGKTYFLSALVPWALKTFNNFRYYKECDLLKKLRNSIADNQGDYLETLKFLIDDELIILDDLGSQGLNEWREEVMFDTIDQRYNSMLPTVITSNFTKAEFEKNYHERISSRIFAKENTLIQIFDTHDLRKEGK